MAPESPGKLTHQQDELLCQLCGSAFLGFLPPMWLLPWAFPAGDPEETPGMAPPISAYSRVHTLVPTLTPLPQLPRQTHLGQLQATVMPLPHPTPQKAQTFPWSEEILQPTGRAPRSSTKPPWASEVAPAHPGRTSCLAALLHLAVGAGQIYDFLRVNWSPSLVKDKQS